MRVIALVLAGLSFMVGGALFLWAFATPFTYGLDTASAVQVSQVYNEGTFRAVLAVAAFAASGVLLLAIVAARD